MEIRGKIKMIGQVQDVSPTFRKRDIVITTEEQYPQHILIQFVQDGCESLNGFQIGEPVEIAINLRGREWVNPQGETVYFNTIQGWRIKPQNQPQQYNQPHGYQGNGSAVNDYMNRQQNNNQQNNQGFSGNQNFNQPQNVPGHVGGYPQQNNGFPPNQQGAGYPTPPPNYNPNDPNNDLPF